MLPTINPEQCHHQSRTSYLHYHPRLVSEVLGRTLSEVLARLVCEMLAKLLWNLISSLVPQTSFLFVYYIKKDNQSGEKVEIGGPRLVWQALPRLVWGNIENIRSHTSQVYYKMKKKITSLEVISKHLPRLFWQTLPSLVWQTLPRQVWQASPRLVRQVLPRLVLQAQTRLVWGNS